MTHDEEAKLAGEAIRRILEHYWKRPCQKRYIEALQVLRDNFIWMTGEISLSDADRRNIASAQEKDTLRAEEDFKFNPACVSDGKGKFLPVFSDLPHIGNFANNNVNVEKHIFNAMDFALGIESCEGIVVNPFDGGFKIPKSNFQILGNLPSKYVGMTPRSMEEMSINESFAGMLWGLVIGDCLGSPIQFTEKDKHPWITQMVPCEHFHTPAGYWTDDTSMAFCIMESYTRLGKYELSDIGNNFVKWYKEGFMSSMPEAFDVGAATAYAIEKIATGKLCNGLETSQGNGSIMRFAPAYIINYGRNDNVILDEISNLTHNSEAVRKVVDRMKRVCDDHLRGERTKITSPYKTREEVNNSGWSVSTLDAALWAFHTTHNFEDGMIAAVNLGGDADSIGAVYGQIAGAYYGLAGIPSRWIMKVKSWKKVQKRIGTFVNTKHLVTHPKKWG